MDSIAPILIIILVPLWITTNQHLRGRIKIHKAHIDKLKKDNEFLRERLNFLNKQQ